MRSTYYSFVVNRHGKSTCQSLRRLFHEHATITIVLLAAVIVTITFYLTGLITLLASEDFSHFEHPLEIAHFDRLAEQLSNQYGNNQSIYYESVVKNLQVQNVTGVVPLKQFEGLNYTIDAACNEPYNIDNKTIPVIVVIKSAVNNYARRQVIRATWLPKNTLGFFSFSTVFMLGACDKKNPVPKSLLEQRGNGSTWEPEDCKLAVLNEAKKYGDIVQSSGIDSYYNNTIKTVMTLRWVESRCDRDGLFLALDDDFVFEVSNFVQFVTKFAVEKLFGLGSIPNSSETLTAIRELSRHPLYLGYVRDFVHPHRTVLSKWYISRKDYAYNRYPRFVTGGSVLMSRETVRRYVVATYLTESFKFDDVYMGIMAYKLKIEAVHEPDFMCSLEEYLEAVDSITPNSTSCIGVHDIAPDKLAELWARRKL